MQKPVPRSDAPRRQALWQLEAELVVLQVDKNRTASIELTE
jgi:hypothetical protein